MITRRHVPPPGRYQCILLVTATEVGCETVCQGALLEFAVAADGARTGMVRPEPLTDAGPPSAWAYRLFADAAPGATGDEPDDDPPAD